MADVRVAAAVDFGTHGTGFAWAFHSEVNRPPTDRTIYYHDQWPGQSTSYIKNRTALLLDGDEVVEWGYAAFRRYNTEGRKHPEWRYVDNFKMGLWDASLVPDGDAVWHITAYLRVFGRFALDQIVTASQVDPEEIRWCLTVPAIWGDRERDIMRKAAVAAGFPADADRLLIAVEPEVAALYCEAHHDKAGIASAGRRFMVVDAGGGTVDITTYEVDAEGGLTQLGYSPGDALGSAFVDKQFVENLLVKRLPVHVVDRFRREDPHAAFDLMDAWERAKRSWDPSHDSPLNIPLPVRLYRALDDAAVARLEVMQDGVDDALVLTPLEVRRLFDTIIGDILKLVDRQITEAGRVAAVLLVGGFAQSAHLQRRMRRHVGNALVVPPTPASAVLLGAVHYALNPQIVVARCSRLTYGIGTTLPVEEGHPGDRNRVFTNGWGEEMCSDRFSPFVRRGEIVDVGRRESARFFPARPGQDSVAFPVYISTDVDPRYTDEGDATLLGTVEIDIKSVTGRSKEEQALQLSMTFGGTEVVVEAVVEQTGERLETSFTFERSPG